MSKNPAGDSRSVFEGEVGILARRRIEAGIIAPIYEEMRERLGEEVAQSILDAAIRKAAVAAGQAFAAKTPGGTNLRTFQELQELWTQDGALVVSVEKATDGEFDYTVTRCRYAEMYREMGLGHIGRLFSCNRDYMFPRGYNPDIGLERTQTLMEGAPCCDFKYRYVKKQKGPQE